MSTSVDERIDVDTLMALEEVLENEETCDVVVNGVECGNAGEWYILYPVDCYHTLRVCCDKCRALVGSDRYAYTCQHDNTWRGSECRFEKIWK